MITEIEQPALDIDWFFTDNKNIGFVASAGGRLPQSVAKSRENIEFLALYFRELTPICDVEVNSNLKEIMSNRKIDDRYLSDFIYMAERGLYSFDKTSLNDFYNASYHLVARPITPLTMDQLPHEVAIIVAQTVTRESIKEYFNSSTFG